MFELFELIQLFKAKTVNPMTRLKSPTTHKRVATRQLRNTALDCLKHLLIGLVYASEKNNERLPYVEFLCTFNT